MMHTTIQTAEVIKGYAAPKQGLVQVIQVSLAGERVTAVSGRELHEKLGVRRDFTTWMKYQIGRAGLVQELDYLLTTIGEQLPSGTKHRDEYVLSLDAAKHLSLMSGTEKGAEIRRYFIEVEKRYRALVTPSYPAPLPAGLTAAGISRAALPGAMDPTQTSPEAFAEMVSKAAFHDAIAAANDAQTLQAAAKALGHGPNRFFKLLRERKVLLFNNLPYQTHLDAGRFKVIERTYADREGIHLYTRTLVTGKGLIYLQQLLAKAGESEESGESGGSGDSSDSSNFREHAA